MTRLFHLKSWFKNRFCFFLRTNIWSSACRFHFFWAYIKFLWPARGLILLSFAKIGSFCANSGLINLILALLYVGDGIWVGKSRVIFMQKIQLNPNLGIHSIWIISLLSQVLGARDSLWLLGSMRRWLLISFIRKFYLKSSDVYSYILASLRRRPAT